MTARTWLGGRALNNVANPRNWSPQGAPQPGDNLTADHGTVNIFGDQLPDTATLNLTGHATANLIFATGDHITASGASINMLNSELSLAHRGQGVTINAVGSNHLDTTAGNARFTFGTIDVNNYGVLTGGFGEFSGDINVHGGLFANTNSWAGDDGKMMFIDADVIGNGNFTVGSFHAPSSPHALHFARSVGTGQTVTMQDGIGFATVDVDHPETFDAAVKWQTTDGIINLHNLAADSYAKHDGVLDFFHGDTLIKSLRFTETVDPHISLLGDGVQIHSAPRFASEAGLFGSDLPQHLAPLAA